MPHPETSRRRRKRQLLVTRSIELNRQGLTTRKRKRTKDPTPDEADFQEQPSSNLLVVVNDASPSLSHSLNNTTPPTDSFSFTSTSASTVVSNPDSNSYEVDPMAYHSDATANSDNDLDSAPPSPDEPQEDDLGLNEDNYQPPDDSILELCGIASKHNLTDACVADIITFTNNERYRGRLTHYPTLKIIEKELGLKRFKVDFYWPCPSCCNVKITPAFSKPYSVKCCGKSFEENSPHFILFDLAQQVKYAINGCKFYEISNKKTEELQDFGYDSTKDLVLTLNTDGTPKYASSKSSLWPLLASINNIGYIEQKKRIIIAGMWLSKGSGKPDFKLFLNNFLNLSKNIHRSSVKWSDVEGFSRSSKIFISSVMCDSIARPSVQMMKQFNAEYGCGYCMHQEKGLYFSHIDSAVRTNVAHTSTCEEVEVSKNARYGVLGRSPFMDIEYFDIILDFPIDVLHAVYLGVADTFTNRWLAPQSRNAAYFISETVMKEIDVCLSTIQPPKRISRLPRALCDRKSFKGHEWNMWLSYYSPILLERILPTEYFNHWLNFVIGITLLNSKQPTNDEIDRAAVLLNEFSAKIEVLYDKTMCRFNVHLVRHLPTFVKRFGPLHSFTMMIYESYNKTLKDYIKSPKGVGLQLVKRHLKEVLLRTHRAADEPLQFTLTSDVVFQKYLPTKKMLLETFISTNDFTFYKSIILNNVRLNSNSNCRSSKRQDYLFWTVNNTVFDVKYYFRHDDVLFAVGLNYIVVPSHIQLDYVFEKTCSAPCWLYIPAIELTGKALQIKCNGLVYFLRFVNDVECFAE